MIIRRIGLGLIAVAIALGSTGMVANDAPAQACQVNVTVTSPSVALTYICINGSGDAGQVVQVWTSNGAGGPPTQPFDIIAFLTLFFACD